MQKEFGIFERIQKLKVTIMALVAVGLGVGFLTIARSFSGDEDWDWLTFWPLGELGGILFSAGLLGIAWDYFDSKDKEQRDTERLRRVLAESAPDLRDAVVQGFAAHPEGLASIFHRGPAGRDSSAVAVVGC